MMHRQPLYPLGWLLSLVLLGSAPAEAGDCQPPGVQSVHFEYKTDYPITRYGPYELADTPAATLTIETFHLVARPPAKQLPAPVRQLDRQLQQRMLHTAARFVTFGEPRPRRSLTPKGLATLMTRAMEEAHDDCLGRCEYARPWSLDIETRPLLVTCDLLSTETNISAYTGGAHPNHVILLDTYDLKTGRKLTLDELFGDGLTALTAAGERHFRQQQGLAPDAPLNEGDYWFEGGRFYLPDNFAFTKTGLRFLFQPYEVAPYAMGALTFTLPYDVVLPRLRPTYRSLLPPR